MGKLKEKFLMPENRPQIIRDCVQLVEDEVNRKSGFAGIAIKGGFMVVKAMKPDMIRNLVDWMLDEFVGNLDPIVERQQGSEPMGRYLEGRRREVAGALLAITDVRARKSQNQALKKVYEKLRSFGEKHVEEAVPAIGRLVERHLGA